MSEQGRVLRSQSRLLREVQDSISVAPRKPRVVEPSLADQTRVQSSARKLFTSPSTSTPHCSSHPLGYDGDEDIELDDIDVDDTSATPRATATGGSVLEHFVPNPELLQGVASAAAGVAASGASVAASGAVRVAKAVTSSLLPEFSSFEPSAERPSRERPSRPSDRPPRTSERPNLGQRRPLAMATRLPPSKYLKTDSIAAFDGSPQDLDTFDISIQSMLELYNFPLYYGGTVRGDPENEYEYVSAVDPEGVSNYVLGKRLCAGLSGRLEKSAQHWWQSYVRDGKPKPNCWRKHADCPARVRGSVPLNVTEVSLYDLLHDHFNTDMDAQKAELELERFTWKPFGKEAMDVVVFRDHVERLLWRAGITGKSRTFQRIRAIRDCLPTKFREVVHMVKSESQLWEAIEIAYSTSEVDYLKQCTGCGKMGHSSDLCRARKATDKSSDEKQCSHCKRKGHVEKDCWSKHGRTGKADDVKKSSAGDVAPASPKPNGHPTSGSRTCFRCGKEGHMARNCPAPAASPSVPVSFVQSGGAHTPFYNIPRVISKVDFRSTVWRSQPIGEVLHDIDAKDVVLGEDAMPLPLQFAMAHTYTEKEVFEVDKYVGDKPAQIGCLWSFSSTVKGQQLLTVWDTGAAVAVVPRSTIVQTGTDWVPQSDIDFVMADGARHTPVGVAPKFVFRIGDLFFVLKVYVVEGANYQLLLGNNFMFDVGAVVFPKWQRVVLSTPVKLEIRASLDPIRRDTCAPLHHEAEAARVVVHRLNTGAPGASCLTESPRVEVVQDDEIVELASPVTVTYVGVFSPDKYLSPVLHVGTVGLRDLASAYRLGMKDLVHDVECQVVEDIDRSLPTFTREFVASCIEFGDVPPAIRAAVCQDVIDYSHAFSWNAFDLGCIADVPHKVIRVDPTPAVQPSRRHLYTPSNEAILHAKCDPYVALGIFQPAAPSCKDRAQVTIVRTGVQDKNDPKHCRVAHDFRAINSRIQLDPEPVDSVPDMLAWMGRAPTGLFFKTDTDRGFYQIVCADDEESVNSTCFELFHRLWVSRRMLFGQKNGPATFKRNAMIMQEELLDEGKTKSYFDDIIGKACGGSSDYDGLQQTWRRLLELAAKHGWKFKPATTKWGFNKIETVGFELSLQGIGVGQKMRSAVESLVFPRTKSELRGLLGLANQFRERIAGYALLVSALTALTRGPERKVVATPEALIEFENLKEVLNSPPILQQFRYDRSTYVYTDASIGSRGDDDIDIPGGLGVVIVQTDDDGIDYVCAYGSAGLTPAQRNYHIVRLELLAFVFACGKFYDWLAGIPFVWRSDCRAHEFLHTARTSTNPTIARYALTLAEFDFRVEWIPGVNMIADSFSRLLLAPCPVSEAISLPEIVFGISIGQRVRGVKDGAAVEPLLLYTPSEELAVEVPLQVEIDDELVGWMQACGTLPHSCIVISLPLPLVITYSIVQGNLSLSYR